MVRNLFQLYSLYASTNENNSGAKIIQFSDHKHKSEQKKHRPPSTRGQSDSLARNIKNQQVFRSQNHHTIYKHLPKTKKNIKSRISITSGLFYTFAICGILFGMFVLFGGIFFLFK